MSIILPPVKCFNEANAVRARIDALGVNSARIIEKEYPPVMPLAGAVQCNWVRIEFWLEAQNVRLELEPLLDKGYDSYQVDSFTADNCRHIRSSKVHQSPLHTELYLEALSQIKKGL